MQLRKVWSVLVVVATVLGGLLTLLLMPWSLRHPDRVDAPPLHVPADLAEAAPPRRTLSGDVFCDRCDRVVPFAAMIVTGDGYFCPTCYRDNIA